MRSGRKSVVVAVIAAAAAAAAAVVVVVVVVVGATAVVVVELPLFSVRAMLSYWTTLKRRIIHKGGTSR